MTLSSRKLFSVTATICALAGSALAAEPEHGSGDPVQVDLWQAGFTVAVFVVLVLVLSRFAFRPILAALQKREDFIRDSLEQAKRDREESERKLKEYTDKIIAARAEATAIVEEGRRDAEALRRKIEEDGKAEAKAILERARREIQIATDTAVKELYTLSAKLATDIAGKIIQKELNPREHERLIEESLGELEEAARR